MLDSHLSFSYLKKDPLIQVIKQQQNMRALFIQSSEKTQIRFSNTQSFL